MTTTNGEPSDENKLEGTKWSFKTITMNMRLRLFPEIHRYSNATIIRSHNKRVIVERTKDTSENKGFIISIDKIQPKDIIDAIQTGEKSFSYQDVYRDKVVCTDFALSEDSLKHIVMAYLTQLSDNDKLEMMRVALTNKTSTEDYIKYHMELKDGK